MNWEEELPEELVLPPTGNLPQLDQVPVVTLQNMNVDIVSSESDEDGSDNPLVISSCLNDPKIVWPSDSDNSLDEENSGKDGKQPSHGTELEKDNESSDDMDVDAEGWSTACASCGDSSVASTTGPVSGSRPGRGRNFARRSLPFFGKIIGIKL